MPVESIGQIEHSYLDVTQATEYLHVSKSHFYAVVRPKLPVIQVGRRTLFAKADLDAYCDSLKQSA